MKTVRPRRMTWVPLLLVMVAGLLSPAVAAALPEDVGERARPDCFESKRSLTLSVVPTIVGLPLAFKTVQVNAANAKILAVRGGCPTLMVAVPNFRWSVRGGVPGLQRTTLTGRNTLKPKAVLGVAGTYVVRLTVCPQSCDIRVAGAEPRRFGPARASLRIRVRDELRFPPETQPTVRTFTTAETTGPTPFPQSERNRKCSFGGGLVDPAWVTTHPFTGAEDYEQGEGRVVWTRISSQDNPFNHDSQDHNWEVRLDAPFRYLSTKSGNIDMEWESDHMPPSVRPTVGDRTSTVGYWIFDCGHSPFNNEIHPPVAIATSRARPIAVSPKFRPPGFPNGMGTNVRVPGVSTDIWINRKAGEITRNCSQTGLHQPATTPFGKGACIRGLNPVNSEFVFNVYLPRDPRIRLAEAGVTAPPVPLYFRTLGGAGGPDPTVTVRQQGSATWLEVRVNPRAMPANVYRRTVQAAWALPATDNWGLRRWRLQLQSMVVHDDHDYTPTPVDFDDGDWRFFLNTNNRDQEWTQLFDCDGCVHGTEQFSTKVRTGDGGRLGPDLLVFPDQSLHVATNGFDDDVAADDDTGAVLDVVPQSQAVNACRQDGCRHRSESSGGEYDLRYTLRPGAAVQPAALSAEGRTLSDAYVVRAERTDCTRDLGSCFVLAAVNETIERDWLPLTTVLGRTRRQCSVFSLEVFKPQPRETNALTGISIDQLRMQVRRLRSADPAAYRALLGDLREVVRETPRSGLYPLIASLRQAFPASDLTTLLPPSLRRRDAVRRVPLQSPARRLEVMRKRLGACS